MVKIQKIKVFCATVLILIAIIIFLRIHGTENLVITKILKIFIPNLYVIKSKQITNQFLKNYLVDFLWFSSLLLFTSLLEKSCYYYLAIIIAILFEILQFFFTCLGTFDFWDMLIYFILFIIVMILRKLKIS